MTQHTQLLIIGSGPAGHTAAVYGARAMLSPILIQGLQPGGQLTITHEVENWPGETMITGPDLMNNLEAHSKALGVDIRHDTVTGLKLDTHPFQATCESGNIITADSVILATGAKARWLGIPGEDSFQGRGVSACATCDGFFFRNQNVVVVGGGNTAAEEALFLTRFADKVTLVHRRDELRADKTLQTRVFNHDKIDVVWNTVVEEICGNETGVTNTLLKNLETGETSSLMCTGVFVAIGHDPATELVKGQIDLTEHGHIVCKPDSTQTSKEGVFAAGDVSDDVYRQAITSAGRGCMAALDAERFLSTRATKSG